MINFARFFLLFEDFETVSKLFLDPQHKDKEWLELQKDFEASGGKELGSGSYGRVFTHPAWPYVVKMFTRDDPYLKFARYAYLHPHKSFPKFYGAPKKITPEFARERHMGEVYLSRIEKLNPLAPGVFKELQQYKIPYNKYRYLIDQEPNARNFYGSLYDLSLQDAKDQLKDMPENIHSALDAMSIVNREASARDWGADDWKSNNIMQRDNGDIVLIDPVWEGYTPQAVAFEQERMEQDFGGFEDMLAHSMEGGGEDVKPKLIRGGERPKNAKKKKPFKSIMQVPDSFSQFSPF